MKIFKLLNPLGLALLMGIFWCQGSFAQTGDYEELDDLRVEPGRVMFFFSNLGGCWITEGPGPGSSINDVTYKFGDSWWQTRVDASSPWTEVPDTRRNGLCPLDPAEPGEYRIIAEITIDGVAGVYTSSNTFTISSSGGPEPGPDPEPEPELSYQDQVQIMYVAYYGRPGDAGGLDFWAGKLEEVKGNLKEIIDSFGNSMEFQERFGDLDDKELVNNIFLQLFGRDADSGGLNFYVNALREGRFTLASLALNVADGTQDLDEMIKTNKLRAANTFSEAYVEADAPYGEFQIDDAKLWLAEVDSTDASVTAALDRMPDLLEMFSGGTTPEPVENFAPADQAAFASLVAGRTIGGFGEERYTFTASRFTETGSEGTYTGSYTYRRTGMNTATLELTYDGNFNGRSVTMLTFDTPTSGTYTSRYTETDYSESSSGSFSL